MNLLIMLLTILSLCSVMTTCVHDVDSDSVPLNLVPKSRFSLTPTEQLKSLEAIIDGDNNLRKLVKDIVLILESKKADKQREYSKALEKSFAAMSIAEGKIGKYAFKLWLSQYLRHLGSAKDSNLLAQLILKESDFGKASLYMQEMDLTNQVKLREYLDKELSLVSMAKWGDSEDLTRLMPPIEAGIPQYDRLLKVTSDRYCHDKQKSYQWDAWEESLAKPALQYWQGLVHECSHEPLKAIVAFQSAGVALSAAKNKEFHSLAVANYQRLVKLLRANDARDQAAAYYKALMYAWELDGVNADDMGLSEEKFALIKINDALWAARYRALIGDYESAKLFVKKASDAISVTYTKVKKLTPEINDQLAEFKAEAYHILSFRIAVELHEYSHAASLARLGENLPHINHEWKDRFQWYGGLYEYLDGDLAQANSIWTRLLENTKDIDVKTKALFWLAYISKQKDQGEKNSDYMNKLSELAPLSYYNVVAPELAEFKNKNLWENNFPQPFELEKNLQEARAKNIDTQREHEKLAPLLLRVEILLMSGLNEWAMPASKDLAKISFASSSPNSELNYFLYLSRLMYAAENYHSSIRLTNQLSEIEDNFWQKNPEQIHVFFPRAYSEIFQRKSRDNSVNISLMYGIARQESLFRVGAKSYVGAQGIMQIIPATARRLAPLSFMEWHEIKDELYLPKINISLASTYIKLLKNRYSDNLAAQIAAYNAGEYAVDMWLKRREFLDPLVWIELIPFGETRNYVQKVWRNKMIYTYLGANRDKVSWKNDYHHKRQALLNLGSKSSHN